MPDTIRNATPNEVGGILRRTVGEKEAAERMKRVKLRHERRRVVKEHVRLSLEEAIEFWYWFQDFLEKGMLGR